MESDTKNRNSRRNVTVAVIVACLIATSPILLLLLWQIPFVYDRHFNRIKARLELLPDTTIVGSWRHEDVSLEDFGFDLQVRQCEPIRLDFYEGGDWYRDFGPIDGIIFSKPYNPATNGYETTPILRDELAQAGIRVTSLTDIVSQLEAVLAYLKTRPPKPTDPPQPAGSYYLRIYYDLNAYKQPHNTG